MFDKQQSSLVLMLWKKKSWQGWRRELLQWKNQCTLYGLRLEKKRRKLPTSRQREKDNIKNNPVFAPGCSTERDSEIYTAPRPPGRTIKYDNKENPDKIFTLQSTDLRIKKDTLKALEWCAGEQLCADRGISTSPSVTYYLSWVSQIRAGSEVERCETFSV